MAATLSGVLSGNLRGKILSSKVLVIGAGGIGCELLKNLVLIGFNDIEVIDLDTIDVSNLNRQFLFHKEHVGKSKAQVAKESVLAFNPDAHIIAHHSSIISTEYGIEFFKKFDLVMNALDNRAARNHVNRLCLAADIPLVESGTAGYLGQVTVIKKRLTECYECQPKAPQKTFPGCTIRNTPSEPIHCIVWAKHLFNQLFGEEDADQDVSPDAEDPELTAVAGEELLKNISHKGNIERKSTRIWARSTGYDPVKLFNKLFHDDIKYLLSMENLWKKRRQPCPLEWNNLPETVSSDSQGLIEDQKIWSIKKCKEVFQQCLSLLQKDLLKQGEGGILVWDKDDDTAMDFVTATSNIRAHIFAIATQSRFDIKSMAGNIIPAIATTNAIIAGLIVMEALKILNGEIEKCKTVYLNRQPTLRKKLLVPCTLVKPNQRCYVCSEKPEVSVLLNTHNVTVQTLEEKIIKGQLGMVAPDVEIDDGKGTILISSEEGETQDNAEKFLSNFGVTHGTRLKCDDFLQNYNLVINVGYVEKLEDNAEFSILGDLLALKTKDKSEELPSTSQESLNSSASQAEDDGSDLMIVDDSELTAVIPIKSRKRKAVERIKEETNKRLKVNDIDVL